MPIYDIYSKRQNGLRGEVPDVYEYEFIPDDYGFRLVILGRRLRA